MGVPEGAPDLPVCAEAPHQRAAPALLAEHLLRAGIRRARPGGQGQIDPWHCIVVRAGLCEFDTVLLSSHQAWMRGHILLHTQRDGRGLGRRQGVLRYRVPGPCVESDHWLCTAEREKRMME